MLIGLTGLKRSGKSTAAKYLVDVYGFTELSFAEPLKSMALDVDPIVHVRDDFKGRRVYRLSEVVEEFGWEEAKDRFPEVRRFLQRLGTEGVRSHLGVNTWADIVEGAIEDIRSDDYYHRNGETTPIVIADVRFENEAEVVVRHGGVVVEVRRLPVVSLPEDAHASEQGVEWDYQIDNVMGKPYVLQSEIDRLVRWLSE